MLEAKRLLGLLVATGMGGMNRRSGFDSRGLGRGGMGVPGLGGLSMGGGLGGALAGLAGAGASSGMLGGRRHGGMGKLIGLSMLGALAYAAMQQRAPAGRFTLAGPEGAAAALDQAADSVSEAEAMLMVRAMVAAANADGRVDEEERRRILEQLQEAGASDEERLLIDRELRQPVSIEELARDAEAPDARLNLYAVSLLAINVDNDAERSYLRFLADRFGLRPDQLERLHREAGVAAASA